MSDAEQQRKAERVEYEKTRMVSMSIEQKRKVERAKYEKIYSLEFIPGTHRRYMMSRYRREDYVRYLATLKDHAFKSLLDVGCGRFHTRALALDHGYKFVQGVDIAGNVCSTVGVTCVEGAHSLPFPDREFDVVTSTDVMEHIIEQDVPAVIEEMCRVAKHRVYMTISHREGSGPMKQRGHITVYPRPWWLMVIKENMPPDARILVHDDSHIRRVKMPVSLLEILLS